MSESSCTCMDRYDMCDFCAEYRENPKADRAAAEGKVRYDLVPWHLMEDVVRVIEHGAAKYGEWNWHTDKIKCSTYVGSTLRHFLAWTKGEDMDPDSGYHHLTHAIAGLLIVLDALANNTLIDDRKKENTDAR